jgi:hypothetical protein
MQSTKLFLGLKRKLPWIPDPSCAMDALATSKTIVKLKLDTNKRVELV